MHCLIVKESFHRGRLPKALCNAGHVRDFGRDTGLYASTPTTHSSWRLCQMILNTGYDIQGMFH